jgi:agmatine/peptidylarginine deiminase
LRLPAEWEPQDAVLLAWPHAATDWAARLAAAESTCAALAAAITHFETTLMCVPDSAIGQRALDCAERAGANLAQMRLVILPYDDTWLRDTGPLTLCNRERSGWVLVDCRFTGWGGKFEASRDDALVAGLVERGVFHAAARRRRLDWTLEGGAIESDGRGTLLTTWRCLHQRHPDQTRPEIEDTLRTVFSATRVLWLDYGHLKGDDTDAHVDTLARFAPDDTIVYQACRDRSDVHYDELAAMRQQLEALRTLDGQPYRLLPLAWPKPVFDNGHRLPASYANYLVINGAVLVPAYGGAADDAAAATIARAHPGRAIVQIPCRGLIWQGGSLHCMAMQVPQGALA